jgi:FAD/FMN-containing dehydrogenase
VRPATICSPPRWCWPTAAASRRADATQHPDLFWALRGGGGNFGVVTRFDYRLHAVGPEVIGGMVLYPWTQARDTLRRFHDWTAHAPDAVTAYACLICGDDTLPVVAIAACYAGPMDAAEPAVAPLRQRGAPSADLLRPMSYVTLQSQFDAARPAGRRNVMRSHFMPTLNDAAIDVLVSHFERAPSPLSTAIVEHCHGAIARVDPAATAFALRRNPFHLELIAFWDDPAMDAANRAWTEAFFAATEPFGSGEVYVNSLDAGEEHRVREAYGGNCDRLRTIKARYDPENRFNCNHNIPPAGAGRPAKP